MHISLVQGGGSLTIPRCGSKSWPWRSRHWRIRLLMGSTQPFSSALRFMMLAWALTCSGVVMAQTDPRFAELNTRIASGELGPITSLLIQQGDTRLHEAYFQGTNANQLRELYSVTKSVGATLIGMAERRGLLDANTTLPNVLPQYAWDTAPFSEHAEMRVHDVLTMRHGIRWDEWSTRADDPTNSYQQMLRSTDWYRYVLSQPRVAPPDSGFTYSTGASQLMSGILRQVSGLSPEQVFVQWLAQPLGIQTHLWQVTTHFAPGHVMHVFPFDDVPMGVGLFLRPRDLLRIGELYLNRGIYNGERLLDASWIDRSWTLYSNADTDAYFSTGPERRGYGYKWWFDEFIDARERRIGCWRAAGAARQHLFICPELDLLVVSTSLIVLYEGPGMGLALREVILPAFELRPAAVPQVSGLWYDPSKPGQGFSLQQVEGGLFGYYFGYDEGKPLWLITDLHRGPIRIGETIQVDVGMPVEGVFGAPQPPDQGGLALWGTLSLRFITCTQGVARLEGLSGSQQFDLVLLAGVDGIDPEDCTNPPAARPLADATGAWFDPATVGQGWHLVQTHVGLVGYFYGYDGAGDPIWLMTAPLADINLGVAHTFDLYAGRGGEFDSPVPPQQMRRWGSVELELTNCREGVARIAGEDGEQEQSLQMLVAVPGIPACHGGDDDG